MSGNGSNQYHAYKLRRNVSLSMDTELATAVEAFISSQGHSIGDGLRVLLRMALAIDPKEVLSETERRRAYKETQLWMQERVEAFFSESGALLKASSAALKLEQHQNGVPRP